MILYLGVIFASICGVTVFNVLLPASPAFALGFWSVAGWVVLAVVLLIAWDGLWATLIRRLPAKWFSHEKKFFVVSRGEKRFYEKIGIRKWKDKVPELGHFTSFRKNKISDPHNNLYLTRYMLEAAYGEVIHLVLSLIGFAVMLFYPFQYRLCIGLPLAIVNIFLNMPSFCILRYNFYKLKILYDVNERKANRVQKSSENAKEEESEKKLAG